MEGHLGWMSAALLVAVLLFLWGYGDLIAGGQKEAGRVRDMLHQERMAAMAKGLSAPDSNFDEAMLLFLAEGRTRASIGGSTRAQGWGIVLISGGLGWYLACLLTPTTGPLRWMGGAGALGLVPSTLGAGLLLHAVLPRRRG